MFGESLFSNALGLAAFAIMLAMQHKNVKPSTIASAMRNVRLASLFFGAGAGPTGAGAADGVVVATQPEPAACGVGVETGIGA
jgi:hypothetical protein